MALAENGKERSRRRMEDKTAAVLRRFGDEQSTLLDRFERLSFEAHLNQAILGRSLSEPSAARSHLRILMEAPQPPLSLAAQVSQGRRGSSLTKIFKKLLKPILPRKKGSAGRKQEQPADVRDPKNWKAFSRSLRV